NESGSMVRLCWPQCLPKAPALVRCVRSLPQHHRDRPSPIPVPSRLRLATTGSDLCSQPGSSRLGNHTLLRAATSGKAWWQCWSPWLSCAHGRAVGRAPQTHLWRPKLVLDSLATTRPATRLRVQPLSGLVPVNRRVLAARAIHLGGLPFPDGRVLPPTAPS